MSFTNEQKLALTCLRSLCISSTAALSFQQLLKDYEDLERRKLDYTGFNSPLAMLKASNEFFIDFSQITKMMMVTAKSTYESTHIVEMVNAQKRNKSKSKVGRSLYSASHLQSRTSQPQVAGMMNRPRRAGQRSSPAVAIRALQSTNNNIAQIRNRNFAPSKMQNNNYKQQARSVPTAMVELPSRRAKVVNNPVSDSFQTPLQSQCTKTVHQAVNEGKQPPYKIVNSELAPVVPIQSPVQTPDVMTSQANKAGFAYSHLNPFSCQKQQIMYDQTELPLYSDHTAFAQCCLKTETRVSTQHRPSVQSRINQIKKLVSSDDLEISNDGQNESKTPEITSEWWENSTLNIMSKLELYCRIKEIPPPEYSHFKIKEGKKFKYQCRVTVEGATYSTYPDDYDTVDQAKIVCTSKAIEKIKAKAHIEKYPLFEGDVDELAMKMYECIANHRTGVFLREVANVFQTEYNQTLPDSFINIILFTHKSIFRIEQNTINYEDIVFAVEEAQLPWIDSSSSFSDDLDPNALPAHYPNLPWEKDTWNVICTYPESTQQFWCCLLGPEYHEKRVDLYNEIELSNTNERPANISLGQHYIAIVHKCPYRVKTVHADPENTKILCFFIDHGDEEWLQEDQLYECKDKFLQLPSQAIALSLDGLEVFGNLDNISYYLSDLQDGTFVAKIVSTEEEFMNKKPIRIVLYDTSTEDDIVMNNVILNKIKDALTLPKIDTSITNDLMVTGISDDGIITCYHKASPYMDIIKYGIQNMVTVKEIMASQRGFYLEGDDLYLIYDDVYKHFVRAKLIGIDNQDANNVVVELVDFGTYRRCDKKKVFKLLPYAAGLNIIPPQALKVQLHGIDTSNPYVISLFRGLIKPDSFCLARYKSLKNGIPQVNLFNRCKNDLQEINEMIKTQLTQMRPESPESISGSSDSSLTILGSDNWSAHLVKDSIWSLPKSKIPNIGERFEVTVIVSQSPKMFYIQADTYSKEFIKMTTALQKYCENTAGTMGSMQLRNGMTFAAYRESTKSWCRVKLLSSYDQNHNKVYCCDYGSIDVVGINDMKELIPEFRILPEQAILAKLYGVKPYNTYEFSGTAAHRFIELTKNKQFEAIVKNIETQEESEERIVTLELYERTGNPFRKQEILISHILISESLALPVKE